MPRWLVTVDLPKENGGGLAAGIYITTATKDEAVAQVRAMLGKATLAAVARPK